MRRLYAFNDTVRSSDVPKWHPKDMVHFGNFSTVNFGTEREPVYRNVEETTCFSHGICNDTWINIFSQTFEDD